MSEYPAEWDAQLAAYESGQPIPESTPEVPTTAAPAENASGDSPVVTAPEPSGNEAAPQPQPIVAAPDYLLPDDPELPDSLKGKTLRDLMEDRKHAWAQAHKAGFDANRQAELERRIQMQEAMIQTVQQRLLQPQAPPAPPVDPWQKRGINPDTDLIDNARGVLGATAELAVEETQRRMNETLQQYEARVRQLEYVQVASQAERAFQTARPAAIPQEEWNSKAYAIASFIKGNGWESHIADPNVHIAAYRMLYGEPPAPRPASAPAAPAAPVSAPVAQPAAPPVGSRPATTPAQAAKLQFRDKDRGVAREMARRMGLSDADFESLEPEFLSNLKGGY